MARNRTVKWGHVADIDYRCKVGSQAWFARHPRNIQKLSAYRRLHMLGPHWRVRLEARRQGRNPSSNMTVKQMLAAGKAMQTPQ